MMSTLCPVCGKGELFKYTDWSELVFLIEYHLEKCSHCGTVMTSPLPDDAILLRFYKESYAFSWFTDHKWAKMRDARLRVREYRNILGKKILDFGGGFGYFSKAAREQMYDCLTFDPFVNKNHAEEGVWDTIVLLHVLEHVRDPLTLLMNLHRYLKPDGNLILAVPNLLSTGYQEVGMQWVWAQPPIAHIYHLTPNGIAALLERSGFVIENMTFRERWDANLYADLKCREKYHRLDLEWFTSPYAKHRLFQKYIAFRNSILRFDSLKHTMNDNDNMELSELCVVAKHIANV